MALRLRRGTDAERQLITPVQGELIYTTDTKLLYVGDGSTAGGTLISGVQDLSNLLDVNVTGATDGQILAYDTNSEKWVATDNVAGTPVTSIFDLDEVFAVEGYVPDAGDVLQFDGIHFVSQKIRRIEGDDSTIMLDTSTNTFTGNFVGDGSGLTNLPGGSGTAISSIFDLNDVFKPFEGYTPDAGDTIIFDGANFVSQKIQRIEGADSTIMLDTSTNTFIGNFVGNVTGDVQGSIFGDDSTLLVDGVNSTLSTSLMTISQNTIDVKTESLDITSKNISIYSTVSDGNVSLAPNLIGVTYKKNLSGVAIEPSQDDYLGGVVMTAENDAGDFSTIKSSFQTRIDPVRGLATSPARQELWLNTYNDEFESVFAVDSRGVTSSAGPFKMPTYTNAADRDSRVIGPEAGMMIFLTDGDGVGNPKFQGYDGASWVNLN